MSREKEIEQAMKNSVVETIYASGWGITLQATDLLECAFTKGAEWADENPKEGLVSIDKVCEWLKNNVYEYTSVVNHDTEETNVELTTDFKSFDEFIDAFSKAMKE